MKATVFIAIVALVFVLPLGQALATVQDTCLTTGQSTATQYVNATVTVKILLVEFSDVHHRTSPSAYTKADFENLFGSSGVYVSPNMYSPDSDEVYGSLRDYFQKMSSGNITVNAYVVNNVIPKGNALIWVQLANTKASYHGGSISGFMSASLSAAVAAGLDVGGLGDNVKLAIVYAGNTYFNGGLNPAANYIGGTIYTMSERQDRPYNEEHSTDKFSRIGIHCHEFAHTLGIGHATGSRADVMEAGTRNGPDNRGAAPAPLNPMHRAQKGWLSPLVISGQQQFDVYYSLTAPQVFRINSNDGSDFFLIENRRFNQTMTIGTTNVPDYNNFAFFPPSWGHGIITQGIFVWRSFGGQLWDYSNNGLLYASGRYGQTWPEGTPSETDDGVPFPGIRNVRVLSPWSDTRNPHGFENGHYMLYVPNTKLGTNVGMEVLSENQAQGYFTVVLYQSAPESASPSMPQNLQIGIYVGGGHANPRLTWAPMQEPDVISGGYIHIDRRTKPLYSPWSAWSEVGTIAGNLSEFIDFTIQQACQGSCPDSVQYRIRAIDNTQKYSMYSDVVSQTYYFYKMIATDNTAEDPDRFRLLQNYPNPFNPTTAFTYDLPEDVHVSLRVFDILGQEVQTVVDQFQKAGRYTVTVDARSLTSGVYVYRIVAGRFADVKRMLLLR